jgi:His-Xaa-Ser system protein HxsD
VWREQAYADRADDHHAVGDTDADRHPPVAGTNDDGHPDRHGAAGPSPTASASGCPASSDRTTSAGSCVARFARLALIPFVARFRRSPSLIAREVTFDVEAYSADAIQRALYKLSDRLSGDVRRSDGLYHCRLKAQPADDDEIERLLADFQMEVLDETLRERIRAETREVRNLILALAFSNTGLVDSDDA